MKSQILPPQSGAAFHLKSGQHLKVIDLYGEQVSDLFCADAVDISDSLSGGKTIDYNESISLRPGHFLYAHSGNALMEIIEDFSPACHDLLVTPCSLQMFQMMKKNSDFHKSCLENLTLALEEFGITEKQITSTFNIFMNVQISENGQIQIKSPKSKAKDYIVLRACRDIIVGLTSCSDEGTNNGTCKSIQFEFGLSAVTCF